ncbi:Cytochrome P450 [Bacillus sp. OV322]|uniref:cytochrome P450 family protein n=1 Tax=Bacillus sp. OV322 TaxID=1882764 RepID=UPI0008E4FAE3|nr:cytochrome P450 [Bacillus sp. OV322]SFC70721.1 Cytochrome P450 [Bacillus sp. OV322]
MELNNNREITKGQNYMFTDAFVQNPYPLYKKLREEAPIYKTLLPGGMHSWLITRHEDASELLKDSRFIKDYTKLSDEPTSHTSIFTQNMLFSDPPDHKRLRGLVQKAFTPKMIEGMRERIQEITDELLDDVKEKGKLNLIDDLAFPLPIIVICEMLGVPSKDREKFRLWSNSLIESGTAESFEEVGQHMSEFIAYLGDWFAQVRGTPCEGMINDLINAEDDGEKLSGEELYGLVSLLIIAGHETTVNLIGNGILSLLEFPEQFGILKNNPELISTAIEELLRFNGPVEFSTDRWAGEDLIFRNVEFKRGDHVIVALNSANRDSQVFKDPDILDITREKSPHLAFGKGIHLCLGAPLARLEGEIAINTLLNRMPDIRLAIDPDELQWRPGMIVRGVKEIPLIF